MKRQRSYCFKCTHFFITWDMHFPRGCRAMNFKSRQMPSSVVFSSSGEQCLKFKPKKQKKTD